MGTLYLVRHGQASFGADDYDQLSALGHDQCVKLGEYWRARGLRFDAVLTGTLRRHAQSFAGIAEGLADATPAPLLWPGLNEYDSEAVIRAIHPAPLERPGNPEMVRHHFRLLRQGLQAWMRGAAQPAGMPSYAEFSAGVAGALNHVLEHHHGGQVLIVSSGGPISTAVGQVLATPAETTIELNLRIRNSSVTEFAFTPKRHMLVTYNTLPHLDFAEGAAMVTYA
ncbi:histidine phosphatase family protein [Roseateles violae]|uniref:Histidine phosphatase family protein n=1 Tax=Roseateles violae TaxID=3058042 RepID=A0ABT8DYP6_9BURK|nr:histidine phosphatase family protein [Pelomonas sp. PFR6]MDN3922711.1 histidine phosphatase family protein [Pelomonas sp. PFR6]